MTVSPDPGNSEPADLTIAICTIGRDGYLQAALQSLVDTTPPGVRLLLVFNTPDDPAIVADVETMLPAWQGPAEVLTTDCRMDIAGSHNTALSACETQYITFMGDDDIVLEPRVERMLRLFETLQPRPAAVGSYCRRLTGRLEEPILRSNKDYGPPSVDSWRDAVAGKELIEIVFPSVIYRTDALRSIGGFDPRFGSAMDVASLTRLAMSAPVIADTRRSFAHRIHAGSVTSSRAFEHAEYVAYTRACLAALWSGEPEPTPEQFKAQEETGWFRGARKRQRVRAEALFRTGGAAIGAGTRLRGSTQLGAAMVLSPSVFYERTRSQVTKTARSQPVVTILLKNTNEYRVPFYEQLRDVLRDRSIELRLVSASGLEEDVAKGDQARLPWAEHRGFREIRLLGRTLLWQPGFDLALGSDLIITEQASKQLFNVALSYMQPVLRTRHAFWGHGRNFQEAIEGASGEGLKRRLTRRAHWFFAYNSLSAEAAIDAGMPSDRVTPVMNSTDTRSIRKVIDAFPEGSDKRIREQHGFGDGPLALFMGGVYEPKRPEFVIDAAKAVRMRVPNFELVIIGDGSMRDVVEVADRDHDWIHWLGGRYGNDRIEPASVCSLQMMPGLVGLNIVDAFALGIPTITTALDWHSPEIDYLESGVNGVVTEAGVSAEAFGAEVAAVLSDSEHLAVLREGARRSGESLSIEDMANRFAQGIEDALNAPVR